MTQYYDDTAKDYAERAEAAAESASQSKQQATTAATTATTQANIATNAAQNAATLVKSELENDVRAMKDAALSAASQASANAAAASGSAVDASHDAIDADQARQAAQVAQTAAETAQGKAEDAQQAAETAQSAAETAQGKAEDAQTAAETAQTAAETAQGKAEDAQDAAEASQGAAEDAQVAAKGSEDAAAASAKLSESWAKGDTGVRDGEDTNNAKYWADQSRSFSPITKADKVTGGDTDGMVAGLDAEGNLTNTGIPSENVAQKDGYYEDMTVGRAENLIDPNAPATRRKFGFDTACGDISITDNGNAIIKAMYGTTYVMNQLVPDEEGEYDIELLNNTKYLYRDGNGDEVIISRTSTVTTRTVHGGVDKLINLTIWFGYNNEPTIQAFYKLFPTWKGADIPYIRGRILSYNGTGVQTIGFNAYNHATGTAELLGGNKYQICGTYTSVSYVNQWGETEELTLDDQGIFTPANNGVITVVGGNDTDTCVHLCWSGYKNFGEPDYKWEPFTKNIKTLAVSDYFQAGMQGFASGRDELTATGYVQRYGVKVFDGTENWSQSQGPESASLIGGIPDMANGNHLTNVACNFFIIRDAFHATNTSGTVIAPGLISNKSLYLYYISKTTGSTNIADLKTWIAARYAEGNPMILVYPLATPVVTTFDQQLNLTYPVNDFGTEQSLPVNTTELISTDLDADIQYSIDFTRTVQHYSEIEKDVEALVADKDHIARDYGDYPEMGAGYARNLVDPNAPGVERLFSVDTSCGTASISDNGNAIVEMFKGRTLNWNQYATNGDAHNGTAGWSNASGQPVGEITADADTHVISYYFAGKCPYYMSTSGGGLYKNAFNKPGHVIMVDWWMRTDSPIALTVNFSTSMIDTNTATWYDGINMASNNGTILRSSDWTHVVAIRRILASPNPNGASLYIANSGSVPNGITIQFRDCQVFDLTQMFGYGKEPRKIADFRALFPEPFYDYDPGTPMNYKGTGIKTVGFNQYKSTNAYIRVRPQPYQITGTYTSLNYSQWPLRTAPTALTLNQATVFNTLYSYQNTYYTALIPIEEYDATKTYKVGDVCVHEGAWARAVVDITAAEEWDESHWTAIGAEALALPKYFHSHAMPVDEDGVFTPPDFGWLYVLGGNDTDTCVHFTWSGYSNGDYEPYWESVRDIDVTQYFPDGMNGVPDTQGANVTASGYISDELYNDKAVQRIQKYVFTGDESFTVTTAGTGITNRRFGWTTQAAYPRDTTRNGYYDVFSNYLTPSGFDLGYNSNSAERVAIANGGACMWATNTSSSLSMVPPTTWGTITTVDAFKAKLKELYDAGKPLVVWYILKTPVVTPINPAINLTYKVADFGTEAALPPAPASFPIDAVVKYSTDYMRELTHMIEEDVRGRVDALDEQMANKADKNGDYRREGLIANAAGNLIDANATPVPAQFMFRTTAGDASVAAQGIAEMQACRGTTHTWNQLAEDYHANTMGVFGEGQVTDAKGGALESNVFQGETIVSNQLVPASKEATASGEGIVEVSTAKAGNAHSLVMAAPRSVVMNQQVQNGDFSDGVNNWPTQAGAKWTKTVSDGVLTATYSSSAGNDSFCPVQQHLPQSIRSHTVLLKLECRLNSSSSSDSQNVYIGYFGSPTQWIYSKLSDITNQWYTVVKKITLSSSVDRIFLGPYSYSSSSWDSTDGDTFQLRNVQLVDLTQYFNGDQTLIDSIQSWDDLVAYDPRFANYVEYNTGTVEGVQPTVKVTGKNLQPKATEARTVAGVTFTPNEDGSITVSGTPTTEATYSTPNCYFKQGSILTASGISEATNIIWSAILLYDKDGNNLYNSGGSTSNKITVDTSLYPTATYMVLRFKRSANNEPVSGKIYPQIELGSVATSYEPYHDGGTAQAPEELFAVGSATDEYEAVSGVTTRNTRQITLPATGWNTYGFSVWKGFVCANVLPVVENRPFYISSNSMIPSILTGSHSPNNIVHAWIGVNDTTTVFVVWNENVTPPSAWLTDGEPDASKFMTWLAANSVTLCYATSVPTTSQSTPAQISLQAGNNVALQTDGGRTADFTLGYDTTSFNIDLDPARSYYTKLFDVESIQTGLSTLAVDATQDKVMDLTLAYAKNRPSTVDELKSRYPGVASLGAYDKGHFVHASGGVWTTGVWNQLVVDGKFESMVSVTTGSNVTSALSDGTVSCTLVNPGNISGTRAVTITGHITKDHKYLVNFDCKAQGVTSLWATNNVGMAAAIRGITTDWQQFGYISRANNNTTYIAYLSFEDPNAAAGSVYYLKNFMAVDLTALCGAGNEPATVETARAYCASIGHDLSTYQAYDAGTPLGGSVDLTGIELKGISSQYGDTYDAESGKHIKRVAESSMSGSWSWTIYKNGNNRGFMASNVLPANGSNFGYVTTSLVIPSRPQDTYNASIINLIMGYNNNSVIYVYWLINSQASIDTVPSEWMIDGDPDQPNVAGFKEWLNVNPIDVVYKVYSPTSTTIQQQHVTLQPGFNAFYQASLGTLAIHDVMTYLGTEWTLKLGSGRKYLYRHEGVDTMLTPSSNMDQPIVSGDKLVDLTWLFGKNANVPATLEDCYALYPHLRGDMPYCPSKMINYNGDALKTVGFNQWDGVIANNNMILKANNTTYADNSFGITDYIRVVDNLEYEISRCRASAAAICWYDINKNYISGQAYGGGGNVVTVRSTAPFNACWARFTVDKKQLSNTVFHLCWSGYRNYGTAGYAYEPYKASVREMRVHDWFPEGLASDAYSGRYDELTQTKSIKRIFRKVLTGDETWSGPTASQGNRYFTITPAALGQTGANARVTGSQFTVTCNIVPQHGTSFPAIAGSVGGIQFGNANANGNLFLMLSYEYYSTVTNITQLQTFLRNRYNAGDPVIIQWPLATPVETDISDEIPQLSYNYEDFGTEEIIPANEAIPYTTPANLLIVYQKDFTRDVANLPENYISKESMADLNAQLGPALNGTISGEYNSATGKFEFSFTRNPTVAALAANASAPSLNIGMTYTQSPTVNVTYTLPTPSDLTQDNVITVDVTCSGHSVTFKQGTATLTPQRSVLTTIGLKYRFLCLWAFSGWVVLPIEIQ